MQYYRGWWYMRVPVSFTEGKVRFELPYDLPTSVYFRVVMLPEKDLNTYTGDILIWPKGWVWHAGGLEPLSHGSVVAVQTGLTMRVAPGALSTLAPGVTQSLQWGAEIPGIGGAFSWKWKNVVGEFSHRPTPNPSSLRGFREFLRGDRTPWLDFKDLAGGASPPAGATSWLVAFAPYHLGPNGEEALSCYPPKGSGNVEATRLSRDGDYPNDPTILWGGHHEALVEPWRPLVEGGWGTVFGSINTDMVQMAQFNQAWLNGAYDFSLWGKNSDQFPIDVSIRRIRGNTLLEVGRLLKLERGVQAEAKAAAILPGSVVAAYHQMFGALRNVNAAPKIPLINLSVPTGPIQITYQVDQLRALDDPIVQAWIAYHGVKFHPGRLRTWAAYVEGEYPGITVHLNTWFERIGENLRKITADSSGGVGSLGLLDMLIIASVEWFYPDKTGLPFIWDPTRPNPDAYVLGQFVSWYMVAEGASTFIETVVYSFAFGATSQILIGEGKGFDTPPEATHLRTPMAWAALLPPVFNQVGALSSVELINLAFSWWRTSAGRLGHPSTLDLAGFNDPTLLSWPGWFPVDDAPQDISPGSWWARYQNIPWSHLMKAPVVQPYANPSQWRFSGTTLSWNSQMDKPYFWPPQPPVTRPSTDGETFPSMVLPTAAYPMGPIEIKFKP